MILRSSLFLWWCSVVTVDSFTATTPTSTLPKPYYELPIDYSAANEFVQEYYNYDGYYFGKNQAVEPIYNAREGFILDQDEDDTYRLVPPSLSKCGFELVSLPSSSPKVDWDDLTSIRENYLFQLETALRSCLENVDEVYFWNPTIRHNVDKASERHSDDSKPTPVSIYAGMAHIDSDVNAYPSVEDYLQVVRSNIVPGTKPLPGDDLVESVQQNNGRFASYNAWRNIGSDPITKAPLAVRPMKYIQPDKAFPIGRPNFGKSPWYFFPHMTPNEVLFFAQYDRDASRPADVWHCALKSIGVDDTDGSPRKSFDVRCFVTFTEKLSSVPKHKDRLAERVTSIPF